LRFVTAASGSGECCRGWPHHGTFQLCRNRISEPREPLTIASTDQVSAGFGWLNLIVLPTAYRFSGAGG
jgi:hypothetical protein